MQHEWDEAGLQATKWYKLNNRYVTCLDIFGTCVNCKLMGAVLVTLTKKEEMQCSTVEALENLKRDKIALAVNILNTSECPPNLERKGYYNV